MEDELNELDAYAARVDGMRPKQRAALLRNHEALVADAARWEALPPEVRETLAAKVELVRAKEEEVSNG